MANAKKICDYVVGTKAVRNRMLNLLPISTVLLCIRIETLLMHYFTTRQGFPLLLAGLACFTPRYSVRPHHGMCLDRPIPDSLQ